MLIRRDGLMAKPYPTGPNFEKLLSSASSRAGSMDRAQLEQYLRSEQMKQRRAEVAAEGKKSSVVDQWMGRPQLQPPPTSSDEAPGVSVGFGWHVGP
jgi:hypothetical protein